MGETLREFRVFGTSSNHYQGFVNMFLMEIHQHFLTDKDIEMYTANPHAGKGKGALVALLQLGLTGPAL